jgi:two-component system, NtrC family, response regulator GlrR
MSSKNRVLIVDDDTNLTELMRMRLETAGYEVVTANEEEEALRQASEQAIDLSIVDLQLVTRDGISVMEQLHLINPLMPVIILTAHGSIESAVRAMKKGAFSYVTKPFESRDLLFQMEKALENHRLSTEIERLKGLIEERYAPTNVVGKSDKMRAILEAITRIARTDSTVLLLGESGTGKDLIARLIHLAGSRRDGPFVAVNCAALPEGLLESTLFGHEKGSFSGAFRSAKGLFLQADGGTIFLDEIGDMPLSTQAKVLRVLQERCFYPVGSEKLTEVDVRVLAATNKNLEEQVKKGLFREDLYYRIHVIPIQLPPLRERKEDIPLLVDHFLEELTKQSGKNIRGLTPQAMQKLMVYDWPGNVRQLKNMIEYAVAMSEKDRITDDLILTSKEKIAEEGQQPLKEAKDAFEKTYLISLLQTTKGNVSETARLAGKYRADLYLLLKKHHINPDDFKQGS